MREAALASHLRSRGHDVCIITTPQREPFFSAMEFPVLAMDLPIVYARPGGLALWRSFAGTLPSLPRMLHRFRQVRRELQRRNARVFISDYEPATARLAYALDKPLILVDQQSKYRHFDFPPIGELDQAGERERLRLFFPRFAHNFILSFFPLPSHAIPSITVLAPLVPQELIAQRSIQQGPKSLVLVYLSEHLGMVSSLGHIDLLATAFPHLEFRLYTSSEKLASNSGATSAPNVTRSRFSRAKFLADLPNALVLISNAGHNLISEAIAAQIPMYLIPLPTFDQHLCASRVQSASLGLVSEAPSVTSLGTLLENADAYRRRIRDYAQNCLPQGDSLACITREVERQAAECA